MTTSELKCQRTSNRAPLDNGPFSSYSLNFEDVIFHRLFPVIENGFYVDVGAGHPRFENDTFSLYQRGWHGINVEPNHGFHGALMEERPRDTNIRAVLADSFGDVFTYYELDGSGLSTCDAEQAAAYQAIGLDVVLREVSTTTLSSILAEAGVVHINILKVDVEGFEEKVLAGNDWERFRPDVVLVEATYPENPVRRPTNILSFMEQRGYRHVLFDGLNDFYLEGAFEAPEGLNLPPNVFDRFVPHQIAELKAQVDALRKHTNTTEEYALSLQAEIQSLRSQLTAAEKDALTLQTEIKSLGGKLTVAEEEASRRQVEISSLGFKLSAAEKDALTLQTEIKSLGGKLTVAEEETSRRQVEISSLGFKLSAAEDRALALQRECEEALHAIDALAVENRRIGHQRASLSSENRRLRGSSDQMRSELLVLNQLLEPLHALTEQTERQRERWDDESTKLKAKLAAVEARLASVYSSRCWLLTAPLRWCDKVLHRIGQPLWGHDARV
jgi:FkbM family methyltransferase